MTLDDALKHYDGSATRLADAIGYTVAAVSNWKDRGGVIPYVAQLHIQEATKGRLKADKLSKKTA